MSECGNTGFETNFCTKYEMEDGEWDCDCKLENENSKTFLEDGETSDVPSDSTGSDEDAIDDVYIDSMQRSVLPVASLSDPSFCENTIPTNGEEYLRLVRLQYLRLPKSKSSAIRTDPSEIQLLENDILKDRSHSHLIPPSPILRSLSNEELHFINQFNQFKRSLAEPISMHLPSLHKNDENGWFFFLYKKQPFTSLDNCITLIQNLPDAFLFTLLRYHRKWALDRLQDEVESKLSFISYVYAILACCKFPFTADEYFNLRSIVKRIEEIVDLSDDCYNLFRTLKFISCHCYGQKDL